MGTGPLQGIRVIELASFISGPFATMMLADLGADVVKIETARGDPLRRFGRSGAPLSPLFINTNRGKRSVVLDLKNADGRARLHELLATADVMLCNWRPSVAPRLGIVDEDLIERNARLVRVYVTGFGGTGALADDPTFDSVIQAHLGSADDDGSAPEILGSYVVDKTAAVMVAQAVLAALFVRERRGVAERVDVALLDAAAYVNFPDTMANRTLLDFAPPSARNRHAAATRAIRASDGWLVVVPVTADQIRRSCAVVGRPALADEILAMPDATALTERMLDELERVIGAGPVSTWVERFRAADVPAGACLTIDEHLADEQVRCNELYRVDNWGDDLGPVRHVRHPARFASWPSLHATSGPPGLGQQTTEVLGQ